MQASQLKKQLEDAIEDRPSSKLLELKTPILSPFLTEELGANLLGTESLILAVDSIEEQLDSVLIKGTSPVLGLDEASIEVKLSFKKRVKQAVVTVNLPASQHNALPGLDWINWKSLHLSLEVGQKNKTRTGKIIGVLDNLPGYRLTGGLAVDTGEDGKISGRTWRLSIDREPPAPGSSPGASAPPPGTVYAFDVIKEIIPAFLNHGIKSVGLEMTPDGSDGWLSALSLETDFSWDMLPTAALKRLGLSFTMLGTMSMKYYKAELTAAVELKNCNKTLGFQGGFSKTGEGLNYDFSLQSSKGGVITLEDLIEAFVPGLKESINPPENVAEKLRDNGFESLRVTLSPSAPAFSFFGAGRLFGLDGEAGFSLRQMDGRPSISFNVRSDAEPMSIPAVLKDILGIPVSPEAADKLPGVNVALRRLAFDQDDGTFRLEGEFGPGRKNAYRLNGGLTLDWSDGLKLGFLLDAGESPVKLADLEKDLPFSLKGIKRVVPRPVITKIGASEFHRFAVNLDTAGGDFSIEGTANLFGKILVSASLRVSRENRKRYLTLHSSVYADPLPIRKLPELIGIDKICGTDVIRLLPKFRLGLRQILLDQRQKRFSISGMVGIGGGRADTTFGIQKHPGNSGVIIDIGFEGDTENPPSLIEFLGGVIPGVDASDIHLPGNLDITLQTLNLHLDSASKSLGGKAAGALMVAGKSVYLSVESKGVEVKRDPGKKRKKLTGTLDGHLSIGNVALAAELNLGDPKLTLKQDAGSKLNFKEVAEFFLGKTLFHTLPKDLANTLAGVEINRFESYIDFENKGIFLDISTGLKNIKLGGDDLLVKEVDIALKLDVSDNRKYCRIDIGGSGSIGSAIIFKKCTFTFEYETKDGKQDWSLGGRFDAQIFGHNMMVEAGYKDIDNVKTMVLHAKDPFPAIEFPGVASFELDDFMLKVEKKEEEKTSWGLSATFQFKTDADIFDLRNGTVALINEPGKTGLMLSADGIDMKIPGSPHLPWFTMDKPLLELLSLKRKTGRVWSVHGKTGFIVHNIPDILSKIFLIENVVAECTINDKKAEFSIGLEDGLIKLPAPPGIGDFGNAYIGINEMKVNLMDGGSLTAKIKFGLPKGLNDIFSTGTDETGTGEKGKLEIFRVYDPDGAKELIGLNMIISAKRGLICELDQSPFTFFEITEDAAGKKILDIDMKKFGRVTIDMPTLSLTPEGSISASGGFDIKEDLRIPLTPLKYLLDQAGLSDISKNINDGIPLKGIDFYSQRKGETRKHFHTDAFFELFTSEPGRVPIPEWLKQGFNIVDDILDRLPDNFLEYGNIEIPKHLHFNLDFTPDGSLTFQVSVKDPESDPENEDEVVPIKMLLPTFPNFMGIELYSLAFGELFGGALLRLDVDMKIDAFNLPSMLAALLFPYDSMPKEIASKLPDPKQFHNSCRIKNLLIIIIYQAAGVPIPIPLFFDELSISYIGPEGVESKSSFGFPKPKLDLADIGTLITEFIGFFKDGKDIDREKVEKISLGDFIIGPNYMRLPKYISTEEDNPEVGTLLGTEEGFTIKPVFLFCALLNAVKNGSINELIQVVEVSRRVGEFDMKLFDLLKVHLEYALTTPYEFIDYAYKELSSFNKDQAREYLEILPPRKTGIRAVEDGEDTYAPITENTEGLVIFMKGNLEIAHALFYDVGFGLVASGDGFAVGAQFDGRLGNIVGIHLRGVIGIKKDGTFLLEGDARWGILEQDLLHGYFCFHNEGLSIKGKAGTGPVRMEGELAGTFTNDLFHLKGSAALVIFNLSVHGGAEILISDAKKMVCLHGDYSIGEFLKLRVTLESQADSSRAAMNLNMEGRLSNLLELSLTASAYAAGRSLQAEGSASMKVLNQEVISAVVEYKTDVISFRGHLDLFPGNTLLEVNGDAAGMLSDEAFELSGDCRMKIVSCPFGEARVLVTDKKMMFTARLFGVTTLLLVGKNDAGLMLYGGMSPIIMGKLLSITGSDQASGMGAANLGGPSLLVSTRSPYFMLQGRVRILGIEASTTIVFASNGFKFNISGNIFNLIKGELTVSGDNFDESENISIEGKIEIGDIAGAVTKQITKVAGDINNQLDLLDNKLADAEAYLRQRQDEVNRLDGQIRSCKNSINNLKRQIDAKKRWYHKSPWYKKSYRWIELGAYVSAKGVKIAALYAGIGVLEGLKLTATGLLEVAKAAVSSGRKMIKEAIGLNNTIARWSRDVLSFGSGLFSIQRAQFSSSLDSACGGSVSINVDLTFMNKSYSLKNIRFSLLNPEVGVDSIVKALKK